MSLRPGAVNFQEKWESLSQTILAVVKLSPVNTVTWNDHYSDIYALCEAFPVSYAEKLFKETQSLLAGFVSELHQVLSDHSCVPLLSSYRQHWLKYQQGAKYLDNLFSYFNRVPLRKYKPPDTSIPFPIGGASAPRPEPAEDVPIQIRHMALRVWKQGLLEKMREHIVAALLQEIKRERDGEEIDMSLIRDIVSSFIEVEEGGSRGPLYYYKEYFETPFLLETGQYYRGEASGMVVNLTCSQYMKNVVARLQAAQRTGARFLHQTSITKFVRECESRLVVDYKDDYLYTHMRGMVKHEQREDLANLYLLLHTIPKAIHPVVLEFEAHVQEQGNQALRQLYEDKSYGVNDFMNVVLHVHGKYRDMVVSLFASHKDFLAALDRACKVFVNCPERPLQQPKAPLLLARYCDQLLRKSSKTVGGGDVEDNLQHAITVFYYVIDKDMFQRFYSRMLSRRLVQGLSLSMEAEENMIQKLKHACGYEYTSRLQRMVVDVHLSKDTVTAFHQHLDTVGKSLPLSFTAMVLQSATWPLQPNNCAPLLPAEPTEAMTAFEKFYIGKHSGRTLTWLHSHSQADLRLTYLKKTYTVCVMTYQMAVLYAFNDQDTYDLPTLSRHTQLPPEELQATLQSLLDCKLLLESSNASDNTLSATTKTYVLNKGYFNKRTKFKITAATQKDSQQDIERTVYSVTEDRKLHIQAAIVRVMKARKVLQHNQLIQEAISQVRSRFSPSVPMIKRCIEALMDKQYLKRMDDAKDTYKYMA